MYFPKFSGIVCFCFIHPTGGGPVYFPKFSGIARSTLVLWVSHGIVFGLCQREQHISRAGFDNRGRKVMSGKQHFDFCWPIPQEVTISIPLVTFWKTKKTQQRGKTKNPVTWVEVVLRSALAVAQFPLWGFNLVQTRGSLRGTASSSVCWFFNQFD